MVDIAFMRAYKPTATPNFHFMSTFVGQQSPKSEFLRRTSSAKIAPFSHRFLGKKTDLRIESLHLEKFSRLYFSIELEFFLSLFSLDMLQPLPESWYRLYNLARSCTKGILGNSVIP